MWERLATDLRRTESPSTRLSRSTVRTFSAIVLAAISVCLTVSLFDIGFATIDDARIMYVYAGYASGVPEPVYSFQSVPWSALIAALYSAAPTVPWYPLSHLALICISLAVLDYRLMEFADAAVVIENRWLCAGARALLVLVTHAFTYLALYLGNIIQLHFETTAGLVGLAAMLLLCRIDLSKRLLSQTKSLVGFSALFFLVCATMKEVFYALSAFVVTLVAWKAVVAWKDETCLRAIALRASAIACSGVLVFAAVMGSNALFRGGEAWSSYFDYNSYRVSFWDYDHTTYKEDPAGYAAVGWSEEFYNLAEHMYFMDERFNEDALSQVIERFNRVSSTVEGPAVYSTLRTIWHVLKDEPIALAQLCLAFALAMIQVWRGVAGGVTKSWLYQLVLMLLIGAMGIFLSYIWVGAEGCP